MASPTLSLLPDQLAELRASFADTFASLAQHFTLAAAEDADIAGAQAVADVLAGVCHSSDVDCEYYPCTLIGPDPSSDEFFAAVGVDRDARAEIGCRDNPRLEVVEARAGQGSALALLTRLGPHALGDLDGHLGPEDREAIDAAITGLAALGPIVGVQLCSDDGVSKVVLTLARRPSGVHVGLLTVRVEN